MNNTHLHFWASVSMSELRNVNFKVAFFRFLFSIHVEVQSFRYLNTSKTAICLEWNLYTMTMYRTEVEMFDSTIRATRNIIWTRTKSIFYLSGAPLIYPSTTAQYIKAWSISYTTRPRATAHLSWTAAFSIGRRSWTRVTVSVDTNTCHTIAFGPFTTHGKDNGNDLKENSTEQKMGYRHVQENSFAPWVGKLCFHLVFWWKYRWIFSRIQSINVDLFEFLNTSDDRSG